jgi:uncharacterized SAM-binding protein YcdF (DUF218 family)
MEGRAVRRAAAEVPSADAIVVLSEGRSVAPGKDRISEWVDADRFFGGVDLFKARKAPRLIFTGGAPPGDLKTSPEGLILRGYAKELGVPDSSIAVTSRVTNTAEEAAAVAKTLSAQSAPRGSRTAAQSRRILLVTSALHVQRAQRVFERAGLAVVPFPVDFRGGSAGRTGFTSVVLSFVPNAAALLGTENAMRELYARAFYAVRY